MFYYHSIAQKTMYVLDTLVRGVLYMTQLTTKGRACSKLHDCMTPGIFKVNRLAGLGNCLYVNLEISRYIATFCGKLTVFNVFDQTCIVF